MKQKPGKMLTMSYPAVLSLDNQEKEKHHLSPTTVQMLLSQAGYLNWATRWHGVEFTPLIQDKIDQWAGRAIDELLEIIDDESCIDYPPSAGFIDYAPANPFTEPEEIPEGYTGHPWRIVESDLADQLLGYVPGDVLMKTPPISAGFDFPRFRVNVSGERTVELHFLTTLIGGQVLITTDGSIIGNEIVDLFRDQATIPPEDAVSIIIERQTVGLGDHYIDCTFVPVLNDEAFPPVRWGGGLRKVVICGADMSLFDVRQNEESPCTLEKSQDGGTIWEAWANLRLCAPRLRNRGGTIEVQQGDGSYVPIDSTQPSDPETYDPPPPNARGEISADDRRCAAAANAANVIKTMHWQVMKDYQPAFVMGTASSLIGAVGALIWFPPLLIIALPLLIAAAAFLGVTTFADFNEDVLSELQCILYTNSSDSDGVITFDYDAVLSAVYREGAIWKVIWYYIQIIQSGGLDLAGATTAITEYDCNCDDGTWCYTFDFRANDGGFVQIVSGAYGAWVSGTGWVATSNSLAIKLIFTQSDDTTITEWEMEGTNLLITQGAYGVFYNGGQYAGIDNNSFADTPEEGFDHYSTALNVSKPMGIWFNPNGTATIEVNRLRFRGTGVNPFGADNCT